MIECTINILNYNSYNKTRVCVESCLTQRNVVYSIVIIDNNSTDDSLEKLKCEYNGRVLFLENKENFGYARGNNLGVQYASDIGARYSLLLNADTELKSSDIVRNMLDVFKANPNCAVVAPTIYNVTSSGLQFVSNDSNYLRQLRLLRILPRTRIISNTLSTINEAHGSALMVDNQRFMKVGGFPEYYFMYCEECTFAKRVQWGGHDIVWYKSDSDYILHHHDKSGKVDKWRLYLMGRNRYFEYYDNKKIAPIRWKLITIITNINRIIKREDMFRLGMKDGKKLKKSGATYEEILASGRDAINRIGE